MLDKNILKAAIRQLGLSNQEIGLHSSLRSFEDVLEHGPQTLADAFLEEGCTLLVPTFSYDYIETPPPQYHTRQNGGEGYLLSLQNAPQKTEIFTPASKKISKADMGAFSAYILNRAGSIRGNHPINSFTAIGPGARRLTQGQTARDVYAPFRQLCADGGMVMLLGVGLTRATIIHYAEQLAGRRLFFFYAKDKAGQVTPILGGGCSEGFDKLSAAVRPLEKQLTVSGSLWRCFPAKTFTEACVAAIRENPAITHCADPSCIRCRDAINGGPIAGFAW